VKIFNKKGPKKWFGYFWFLNHSLKWFLMVPPKDGFAQHDGVWPMAQWHSCSILHHIMMLTRKFDTMDAHFEWKHSQYSPIMASQCFHCWLCPRGNQLHQVKSLFLPPFYPTNCQLSIIHVICPNGCNMHQHWLYLNPPSFICNAFSFLWDYMVRHWHFLLFMECEKSMAKTSMYQNKKTQHYIVMYCKN
jgi:hypothetical protein